MPISTLDLQLSNYVQTSDGIGIIEEIQPLTVRVTVGQNAPKFYKAKDVEPIELTHEIFEKADFEYIHELAGYADSKHCVFKRIEGYAFHPFCTNDEHCVLKITYVHEFQQVFKMFSKNELPLEL
jgi:hypothetical protein